MFSQTQNRLRIDSALSICLVNRISVLAKILVALWEKVLCFGVGFWAAGASAAPGCSSGDAEAFVIRPVPRSLCPAASEAFGGVWMNALSRHLNVQKNCWDVPTGLSIHSSLCGTSSTPCSVWWWTCYLLYRKDGLPHQCVLCHWHLREYCSADCAYSEPRGSNKAVHPSVHWKTGEWGVSEPSLHHLDVWRTSLLRCGGNLQPFNKKQRHIPHQAPCY